MQERGQDHYTQHPVMDTAMIRSLPAQACACDPGQPGPVVCKVRQIWGDRLYKKLRREPLPVLRRYVQAAPCRPWRTRARSRRTLQPAPPQPPAAPEPEPAQVPDQPVTVPAADSEQFPWLRGRPVSTPDSGVTAVLLRMQQLAERFGGLDEREGEHFRDVSEALTGLARRSTSCAAPSPAKARSRVAQGGEREARRARRCDRAAPATRAGALYYPAPSIRWWAPDLSDEDRAKAMARLRNWVEVIYRPHYGHLAAKLSDCWGGCIRSPSCSSTGAANCGRRCTCGLPGHRPFCPHKRSSAHAFCLLLLTSSPARLTGAGTSGPRSRPDGAPGELPQRAGGSRTPVWAGGGLAGVPCRAGGKRPVPEHGLLEATTDHGQIERWWRAVPNANVGIATGAPGPDALDVDVHKGGTGFGPLRELKQAGLVPEPLAIIRTPSGGAHLYYQGTEQRNGHLSGKHLDYRARAGMSWHRRPGSPNGITKSSSISRATRPSIGRPRSSCLPGAGTSALPATAAAGGDRPRDLSHLPGWVASQPEGNRNHGLFWAANRAAEAGDTETLGSLASAARAAGLDDREIDRTIRSAQQTAGRGAGRSFEHPAPPAPVTVQPYPQAEAEAGALALAHERAHHGVPAPDGSLIPIHHANGEI